MQKSNGKLYWYGSGGDILAETDASGNTTAEYIFFGGKRVAMLPAGGNPIYYVEDLLGTSRVVTDASGVVCYDADFYPFGGERSYTNTCPQNYKFEGKERDTETGNDDFGARYYSNRFGRWLSADWSAIPAPVPYANLTNPQTLNLYAMVADDPESFADLDGHCDPNDWCGTVAGLAKGTFNFVVHAAESVVDTVQSFGDHDAGVGKTTQGITDTLVTAEEAYRTEGVSGVVNNVLAQDREGATEIVTEAVLTGGLAATSRVNSTRPETAQEPHSSVTTPYERPTGATTVEQRAAVQGKPCVDCGKTADKMVANHKTPLVKEYYKTGKIDTNRMRSVDSVNSQCQTCSAKQGAQLAQYSKKMKEKIEQPK